MTRSLSIPIAAMFALAIAGSSMAQMRGSIPQPGDQMPDVEGFDAEGNPFKLTKLHGKHTVIVFGCLT